MIRFRVWALGAATLCVLGCGDDGGPEQDLPEGRTSVRSTVESLLSAQCEQVFSCCETGELSLLLGPVADVADCTARYMQVLESGAYPPYLGQTSLNTYQLRGLLSNGIRESAVSPDTAGVEACIADITATACQKAVEGSVRCTPSSVPVYETCTLSGLFAGKLSEGDACDVDIECSTGLRCIIFGTGYGTCAPSLETGDLCFRDYDCTDQLVCDYQSGTCIEGGAENAVCEFRSSSNPIIGTETTRCAKSLACNPISGTCHAQGVCNFGSYCSQDGQCPDDLYCVESRCNIKAIVGETCRSANAECVSNWCDYQQDQGEYLCRSTVTTGGTCDPSQSSSQCVGGHCDGTTSLCVAYGVEGAACPEFQCDSQEGFQCINSLCTATPLVVGADCAADYQCASGNCETTCIAAIAIDAACTLNAGACVEGAFCSTGGADTGVCEARRGHGQKCDNDIQCWGSCEVSFGVQRCIGVAPGQAVCDGA
jgi:hypothetical protein